MRAKKFLAMAIALGLAVGVTAMPILAADKKTFVFGDTTFNAENEEADINPQNTYAGWACIRYGVGETLFRYSDTMEIEPWIAKEYENIDELTWKITLNDGVVFSNGRACDGEAVKEKFASSGQLNPMADLNWKSLGSVAVSRCCSFCSTVSNTF